jgi:hypothetical protein
VNASRFKPLVHALNCATPGLARELALKSGATEPACTNRNVLQGRRREISFV